MVTATLLRRLIRCRQEGVHLVLLQICDQRAGGFFHGNVLQFTAPLEMLRAVQTDETRQRVYSAKSLVSRRHAAFSFFFQFKQKGAYPLTRQVSDFEAVNGFTGLSCGKGQKQPKRVAVAFLRIGSQVAFSDQILHQEPANPGTQQIWINHGRPPLWRIVQNACQLPPAVPGSCSGTPEWLGY